MTSDGVLTPKEAAITVTVPDGASARLGLSGDGGSLDITAHLAGLAAAGGKAPETTNSVEFAVLHIDDEIEFHQGGESLSSQEAAARVANAIVLALTRAV